MFAKRVFVTALVVGLCLAASMASASYEIFNGIGNWNVGANWSGGDENVGNVPPTNLFVNINGMATVDDAEGIGGVNVEGGIPYDGSITVTGPNGVLTDNGGGAYNGVTPDGRELVLMVGYSGQPSWLLVTNGGRLTCGAKSMEMGVIEDSPGGTTTVSSGGTLTAGSLYINSAVATGAKSLLAITGANSLAQFAGNCVVGSAGTATVDLTGGVLSVGDLLVGAGTAQFNFGGGEIQVVDDVDVTGATFDFLEMGSPTLPSYTLLTYGGTFTGSPTLTNVPFGYEVQIGSGAASLVRVPEPSTLALLAGGLFGLLAYAWRKRK